MSAGEDFTCAVFSQGGVKCWGKNGPQLGIDSQANVGDDVDEMGDALPFLQLPDKAKRVRAGYNFACALLDSDQLVCWGENFDLGFHQACALLDNGDLKCWGSGEYGENGSGTEHDIGTRPGDMGDRLAPIDFGDRKVLQIAVPGYSTCALLDSNGLLGRRRLRRECYACAQRRFLW